MLRFAGDDFDFDQGIFGQPGYLHGGARRSGAAIGLKIFSINCIHSGEVGHIFKEDRRFDDAGEVQSCGGENGLQVLENAMGLGLDAACNQLSSSGVDGDLAGGKNEIANANCLGVGPDGGRRLRGLDCSFRFAHTFPL